MRQATAKLLRRLADRLDPDTTKNMYLRGVYYDGRHFVLTDPAVTIYARTGDRVCDGERTDN